MSASEETCQSLSAQHWGGWVCNQFECDCDHYHGENNEIDMPADLALACSTLRPPDTEHHRETPTCRQGRSQQVWGGVETRRRSSKEEGKGRCVCGP